MTKKQRKMLVRILLTLLMMIALYVAHRVGLWPETKQGGKLLWAICYVLPYGIIGYDVLKKAVKGILNRQVFDENFLMAVATVGAFCLREYQEAVAVMLFYQIGELFQSYAVGKSRRSISELMDIRPDYAVVLEDGEREKAKTVDPSEVMVGSMILVKPGEKIPIDGRIVEGEASINTSALTGESMPRDVSVGDCVISGCINLNGVLQIQTTKEFAESTVSKILDLVENASSKKAKSEQFIAKFARYYTPIVCYAALGLALLVPLLQWLVFRQEPAFGSWVYRALTFLVISCPCALVISIPLSFFAGIGAASRAGILIKGSNYMETLAKTKTVVFDKTGTMTQGVFEVVAVYPVDMEERELLHLAAQGESYSTHPIAKSIQRGYELRKTATDQGLDPKQVTEVEEISGHGILAKVSGIQVAIGNERLMERLAIEPEQPKETGTVIYVAREGRYAGAIVIADQLKPTAKEAIVALGEIGVDHTVMLTGDREEVAKEVAQSLSIQQVYSELLPEDKVEQVEALLGAQQGKGKLAFVGDGINDAPVLSRADIGIAMGAMGSDAAIEAADIVLMDDDPKKIAAAIHLAKNCIRIVYENIYFALGVKLLCLLLAAFGIANMWLAVFADVGVMILAVCNAIRMLFWRNSGIRHRNQSSCSG